MNSNFHYWRTYHGQRRHCIFLPDHEKETEYKNEYNKEASGNPFQIEVIPAECKDVKYLFDEAHEGE